MSDGVIMVPGLLVFVALGVLVWAIATHNRFARLGYLISESWANVDVALKRRHDLIPNLVATVKAYAAHEQALFVEVAAQRERAMAALSNLSELRDAENGLAHSVSAVLARVESYPELKASEGFRALQAELANTEDRIAAARRFYNSNVREFNTMLESFPSSLLAGGRTARDFFEIDSVSMREPQGVYGPSQI